ncbi:thioredoxin family protein [Kiritimatiella glycovorans]|uniref:Thioredoxin-1 n=1 Tax=Kiritimatiella glycovorans TaxID=1307763 RepID=A0A0G3EEH4_9BACT|nr:thioredoxin family protein [Kiritimatiella glycovorans]AKJ64841.1 Thioredoxin-1 [Kiritimatiella glycovorans]
MTTKKSILFRAVRILVITAVAFAVIVVVQLHRQKAAREVVPSAHVVELAEDANLDDLLTGTPLVLVSYGGEACGHCRALKPNLHRLADALPGTMRVVLVDTDTHRALARESGVEAIPDTRLYVGGKSTDRRLGYQDDNALKEWLRPHIAAAAFIHTDDHHGHGHEHH